MIRSFWFAKISVCVFCLAAAVCPSAFAAPFLWGAVGHNDSTDSPSYNSVSLDQQMKLLTAAGLNAYRSGCSPANCGTLYQLAAKSGVTMLRGFAIWPDAKSDETQNHKLGYDFAFAATSNDANTVQYYEASNEVDNWVGMKGDGSDPSQYDPARYAQARGLIRGLIEGAHAGNHAAKVMVDNSGWCHYGFMKMLWADGVRWDITALHWYSNEGNIEKAGCNNVNVAAVHASFGLPVWITEFNSSAAASANDPAGAASWICSFISQIHNVAPKYNIQAAFVYELLDEPNLQGQERFFGIVDASGNPKPAYKTIGGVLNSSNGYRCALAPNPPASLQVH